MNSILIQGANVIDCKAKAAQMGCSIFIEDGLIKEVSSQPLHKNADQVIELRSDQYLLPGLIDAHVHVTVWNLDLNSMFTTVPTLMALHAARILERMLQRGFTTVRDAGGADFGLAQAVEERLIQSPRLFYSGKAISETGGHGDFRKKSALFVSCGCAQPEYILPHLADGIPEIIKAAREELRKGAKQIKLMDSGGVSSPNDTLSDCGYRPEEIKAAVQVAQDHNTYVMAHAYSSASIKRYIEAGARSIEHGNFLDEETAKLMAKLGAYLVPTLVTYESLVKFGEQYGYPKYNIEKARAVLSAALSSLKNAKKAGVNIGFGTDLLGQCHDYQTHEFLIRSEVESPYDTIMSATAINAELMNMKGKLGVISPGAFADLIVINGNPLNDVRLLVGQGENLSLIMKQGIIFKQQGSNKNGN